MNFPDVEDFKAVLGVEPSGFDQDTLTFWYSFDAGDGSIKLLMSFSVLMKSFQVNISVAGHEVAMVSSEGVEWIRLVSEGDEKKISVSFLEDMCFSGVTLVVEPQLYLDWHALTR